MTPVPVRRQAVLPVGWRLVFLLGTISVFGPLCIDMYLPALPGIGRDLHASASASQLTLTACLVGIAAGQLIIGPVSDRLGRRGPLLAGLAVFVLSSLLCALAPSIYALIVFRLFQGAGGASGIVISRSIARDLHSGDALARFFSALMLATGLGPVFAPQLGSWVLAFTNWRGIFAVLAVFGSVLMIVAWRRIPETLPSALRATGAVWSALRAMGAVISDRIFVGYSLACALAMGALFAYVSGSSFVLQNTFGLSARAYGLVFSVNAGAMVAGAQLSARLAGRLSARVLFAAGLAAMLAGSAAVLAVIAGHLAGLPALVPALMLMLAGWGMTSPNAIGLAIHRYPQAAGAASAVLGFLQFAVAAIVAPLPGLGGNSDPMPMAVLIFAFPLAAAACLLLLYQPASTRQRQQPETEATANQCLEPI